MIKTRWIQCPVCNNKTRNKIRADTELKNYPLYCPKCRRLLTASNTLEADDFAK
ncbi:conjugal transfer protein [bacterium C-53]|nr:conjugal transfer protein [Lachnospiraceae bacterium]NBI04137.1 conjugal transfer protein [Lachnospiraceae bacterium]RKJ08610.1 conjugal transfer protein [bacterium C-53]